MSIAEIKKLLGNQKLIIGNERVLKNLRNDKIEKIFVSSNCSSEKLDDLKHYASLNNVKVDALDIPNDELGVVCKKPFFVSVIGILR
ncbi:MAG: ribosomal L7Ae/L30e/S12e/Gadd45 family protein [archaeon]